MSKFCQKKKTPPVSIILMYQRIAYVKSNLREIMNVTLGKNVSTIF